jgi:type II secretory pathway component GspD/PulD (secretin)
MSFKNNTCWLLLLLMSSILARPSLGQGTGMSLNVKNIPVQELVKLIAEEGELDIAIEPGIAGNVTMFIQDLAPLSVLDIVAQMLDAAYVERDGVYVLMTAANYQKRTGEVFQDARTTQWFPLAHVPVQSIAASLEGLRSPNGRVIPDVQNNAILVVDTRSRVNQIREFLAAADQPEVLASIALQQSTPSDMIALLQDHLPEGVVVEADPAGRQLLFKGRRGALEEVQELTSLLDRPSALVTRAVRPTYVAADSIQTLLTPLLTPNVGKMEIDVRSNRLFVTDFPANLDAVEARLREIDHAQDQVLIEARILQLTLDEQTRVGIDWEVLQDDLNARAEFPILDEGESRLTGTFGDLVSRDFLVTVEALSEFGQTDLLSSPRIVVKDGGTGTINVGSQVPYITVDTREGPSGDVINRFEKVTIVDVGVSLVVKAHIHDDDMITMDVRPEVSSVVGFSSDIPVVETSSAESRMTVANGRSLILGGLNRKEIRRTRKGIPILKDIPLLKYLFSSSSNQEVRTELAIILTPRILRGDEDVEEWLPSDAEERLGTP